MSETVSLSDPRYAREIQDEIERIRDSGLLGRARGLPTLFDYLVQRSQQGHAPKESEIAIDVFHCDPSTATEGSGSRTYIHRLRRKLEEFYRTRPEQTAVRLALPLGEYRLVALVGQNGHGQEQLPPLDLQWHSPSWSKKWMVVGLIAIFSLAAGTGAYLAGRPGPRAAAAAISSDPAAAVRQTAFWQALLAEKRPTAVIQGDYYMFVEFDEHHQVRRLVRDLAINSGEDLRNYIAANPGTAKQLGGTYLNYVPYSVSLSMFEIRPVLSQDIQLRVLSSSTLKAAGSQWGTSVPYYSNMLYVGLLDGMGVLQGPTFAASRFTVDPEFKHLTDHGTGKVYPMEPRTQTEAAPVQQFGLVSSFRGPQGNRILLICGTDDMALVTLTKLLTRKEGVAQLESLAANAGSFEALYEVNAAPTLITQARLIVASRLDPSKIWSPERTPNAFN
jgi:hypothetical protein